MMEKKEMLERLQDLRKKLYEAAEAKGSLTDPVVLAISEEADGLIVELQQRQREQRLEKQMKKGL
ncbi:hypothetical protein B8V81_2060 [Paenibacillus pasadenensis]|uniref:Spo0E like sporulation regulatory protein n=2 Tax=Paenibacillus TaxID=44249 RepID=A0A2N5MZX3_9BACL|nr:hypothetical protein B8V81_2060 [Paenibacillus pasadenensis]